MVKKNTKKLLKVKTIKKIKIANLGVSPILDLDPNKIVATFCDGDEGFCDNTRYWGAKTVMQDMNSSSDMVLLEQCFAPH